MIDAPPGVPTASTGRPLRSTIVGAIDERGRLRAAGEFALPGVKSKSVSSLLSRKPRPGTTIPLPPVCSIVNVYSTTLPLASAIVMFVVFGPSVDVDTVPAPVSGQLPGATGDVAAVVPISCRRALANGWDSRQVSGTGTKPGSPR